MEQEQKKEEDKLTVEIALPNKLILKSKELINSKNKPTFELQTKLDGKTRLEEKLDRSAMKGKNLEPSSVINDKNPNSKLENLTKYFESNGVSFLNKISSTRPENKGYIDAPEESFEAGVDLVNQINTSGSLKGFKIDVNQRVDTGNSRRSSQNSFRK